jgi:flagellar biosynthesis GTPase FlhF
MGAALTTQNAKSNLELRRRIDYIAKNFIFDSDFTDMTKLGNEKYCNRLVKKVSDIFKKNKDSIDIVLLRKKLYEMKKSKTADSEFEENETNFENETSSNASRDNVEKKTQNEPPPPPSPPASRQEEPRQEQRQERVRGGEIKSKTQTRSSIHTTTKKRIPSSQKIHNIKKKCNEIATFYVLFAHLFSCIVSTINPSFEIDASSSDDKKNTSNALDFCSSRLNSLINGELIENSEGDVTIRPNVCKTNLSESGSPLRLVDLPGIKALLKLFKNGGDDFREDVKYLYKAFTGKDAPDDINIEHIPPLHVFNKDVECRGSGSSSGSSRSESRGGAPPYDDDSYRYSRNSEEREIRNLDVDIRSGIYSTGVIGNPTKEKLFSDYIKNIKLMIQKSEMNRSLLLEILSEMFTYTYDSDDEISGVIITPSLTFKDLQSLVRRTRKIIIKLYTECEEDYNAGLDIFFALIQEKILSKLALQDDILRKELEQSIYGKQERYIPLPANPFINPYENPYQNKNPNMNQFVTPHFKQDAIKEFKKILKDNNDDASDKELSQQFKILKQGLDEWIKAEIQYANGPEMLDPYQVANEYYESTNYEEDEEDVSDSIASSPAASSPAVVPGAPAVVPGAPAVVPGAPPVVPSTPFLPAIPAPSPKKIKKKNT